MSTRTDATRRQTLQNITTRDPSTAATRHDPHRIEQFHRWGVDRPDGMDIVDARHLIDIASDLCFTGSAHACHVTDLLDRQVQQQLARLRDEVRSESDRFRAVSRPSAPSDTDAT